MPQPAGVRRESLPLARRGLAERGRPRRQAVVARELAKLPRIAPIAEDDPRRHLVYNLAHQIHRATRLADFLAEKVDGLEHDEDLIWGRAVEERKDAPQTRGPAGAVGDQSYTLRRGEAKPNGYLAQFLVVDAHLGKLNAIAISAGLADQRLKLEERTRDRLENAINSIVDDLGLNPRDHDDLGLNPRDHAVRRVIRDRLAAASLG